MGKSSKVKKPQEVFHVEVITKARVVPVDTSEDEGPDDKKKKGKGRQDKRKKVFAKWEYYVKWANYDSDANSWEPEENLEGCQRLRESFWRHVGMDNDDYSIGYEVSASQTWIDKEKAFFKSEFAMAQEGLERHKKEVRNAKKAKKRKADSLKRHSIVVSRQTSEKKHKGISLNNSYKGQQSSEDDEPLKTTTIPPSNRKRKRVPASSSEDEASLNATKDSWPQKHTKLDTSRLTVREEEGIIPRSASPTSLFSVPSSPEIPLIHDALPSMSTENTSMATDEPPPAIKISQRPDNPHAKMADTLPSELAAGGGISIKQRLSVGALAPTNPKSGPPPLPKPALKPPLPKSHPSTLVGLKIKKMTPSLSITTDVTSIQSPHPTTIVSPSITNLTPTLALLPTPTFHQPTIPNERILPSITPESFSMDQAERFLQEIMPSGLAGPLIPAQEPLMEPLPPMPVHSKPVLTGRIPKKWQWLGPLFLNASASSFCDVKIHNVTEQKPGMRFSVAFEGVTGLTVSTLQNVLDLRSILPAFRSWTQLASLSPQEEKDHEVFKVLYRYMEKTSKVILKPILLDNSVIGQILISPPSLMRILHRLRVPVGFAQPEYLVVALLPWALSGAQLAKESRLPNSEPQTMLPTLEPDRWTRSMRLKPAYQHALRILGFPQELHNYMHDRLFCIWWNHRTSSKNAGLETKLLYNIMEQARAKPAGYTNEARVVFVHVSALATLHKLPGLVERRSKRTHVNFYTYGSHEDVFPSLWSVKEIYPCGGIITFSPSAMFHDPINLLHKIKQINAHSLWECYILPSALGMLTKMVCGDDDPLVVFERGGFSHEFILKAIAAGEVALIHAPPEKATTHSTNDKQQIWMRQYLSLISFTAKHALEIGVGAFHSKYANIPMSEWPHTMETEILTDLSSMQRQPAIMKDYRRYVVFISEQEAHASPSFAGLEWTTMSKFDFKDNFHPVKQTINM